MPLLVIAVYLPIALALLLAVYLFSGVFGVAVCVFAGVFRALADGNLCNDSGDCQAGWGDD